MWRIREYQNKIHEHLENLWLDVYLETQPVSLGIAGLLLYPLSKSNRFSKCS